MSRFARRLVAGIAWILLFGAAAQADPLQDASTALGANTVHSLHLTAIGERSQFAQGLWTADSYLPMRAIKNYDATFDFDSAASRVESVVVTSPTAGYFVGDRHSLEFLSDGFAWSTSEEPMGRPLEPNRPTDQPQPNARSERLFWLWTSTPQGVLKAAAKGNVHTVLGGTEVTYMIDGRRVTAFINQLHQVERTETLMSDPVMGDTRLTTRYSGYRNFDGLQFPSLISQYENNYPIISLSVVTVQMNPTVARIPVPDNVKTYVAPVRAVKLQSIADGVYWVTGATHHSMAVDMGDFLVVVEAPIDDARSRAVISEVKKTLPGKPIRYVVNTHVHFDHSGGLLAYVDEGATVVTHAANREFYERAWAAPRTLDPDRNTRAAKQPTFLTVDDQLTIDGTNGRRIELHHLQGNPHNEESLVAWLPSERILFEADMLNGVAYNAPEPHPTPAIINFYDNLHRLQIEPLHIVGGHGPRIDTPTDLNFAVGQASVR